MRGVLPPSVGGVPVIPSESRRPVFSTPPLRKKARRDASDGHPPALLKSVNGCSKVRSRRLGLRDCWGIGSNGAGVLIEVTEDQFEIQGNCVIHRPTRARVYFDPGGAEPIRVNWGSAGRCSDRGEMYDASEIMELAIQLSRQGARE